MPQNEYLVMTTNKTFKVKADRWEIDGTMIKFYAYDHDFFKDVVWAFPYNKVIAIQKI